jgi:hypothetical protein
MQTGVTVGLTQVILRKLRNKLVWVCGQGGLHWQKVLRGEPSWEGKSFPNGG